MDEKRRHFLEATPVIDGQEDCPHGSKANEANNYTAKWATMASGEAHRKPRNVQRATGGTR